MRAKSAFEQKQDERANEGRPGEKELRKMNKNGKFYADIMSPQPRATRILGALKAENENDSAEQKVDKIIQLRDPIYLHYRFNILRRLSAIHQPPAQISPFDGSRSAVATHEWRRWRRRRRCLSANHSPKETVHTCASIIRT